MSQCSIITVTYTDFCLWVRFAFSHWQTNPMGNPQSVSCGKTFQTSLIQRRQSPISTVFCSEMEACLPCLMARFPGFSSHGRGLAAPDNLWRNHKSYPASSNEVFPKNCTSFYPQFSSHISHNFFHSYFLWFVLLFVCLCKSNSIPTLQRLGYNALLTWKIRIYLGFNNTCISFALIQYIQYKITINKENIIFNKHLKLNN